MCPDAAERPAAGQTWNAGAYAGNASFVAELGADLVELLAPRPGEEILDLGCGDGTLTRRLAESGATVTGLDPSPDLAAAARQTGLAILEQDAHEPFGEQAFDAIFSNAAFHWMTDPERVLRNAHQALRPGGRLVVEQGGFGNVVAIVTALHAALEAAGHPERARCPWDFPAPQTQRGRLERAGFRVGTIALRPRPTPLAAGLGAWLDVFAGPYLEGLPAETGAEIQADTVRRLSGLHDPEIGWVADYVRLRFEATRPD